MNLRGKRQTKHEVTLSPPHLVSKIPFNANKATPASHQYFSTDCLSMLNVYIPLIMMQNRRDKIERKAAAS